ncbi:MAG: choline ABC transporter substrate-binding protein [Tabrizicola sp.]|nr:choline ABC transporter substrate-binding protein [Tabrizicola sp.]
MNIRSTLLTTAVTFALAGSAFAEGCDKVVFSDVGWTDITVNTAAASLILNALGYETETKLLSVPVTYSGMASGDVDIFLGNWMPTMEADIAAYRDAGTVETITENLKGTQYTLATNAHGAALGIKSYADLAPNADALEGKIYGIEPGNDGNRLVLDRITNDDYGMSVFELVESSEQGMLAQAVKLDGEGKPVVFLGWAPHPMNSAMELTYLTGGEEWFGESGSVYTNTRAGFVAECPNTGKLFTNMVFTMEMENTLMGAILNDGADPTEAAKAWLAANPDTWTAWLDGVTAKDGSDAVAAVTAALQ